MEPAVLADAKSRQASFWRRTPDYKAVVGLLTEAVEEKWDARRVATLWRDAKPPANADDQHADLFPSVRKRIELVARAILEEMKKPEPTPEEQKPEESDPQEEQKLQFSIVVERQGDDVTVKLDQGQTTVAERKAKAKLSDYRSAVRFVSDKLGTDILKLK